MDAFDSAPVAVHWTRRRQKHFQTAFNASLEASPQGLAGPPSCPHPVAPAVVQGAGYHAVIQTDVARRMKKEGDARPLPQGLIAADRQRDGQLTSLDVGDL